MFVDPDSSMSGEYLDFAQDLTSLLAGADARITGSAFFARLTLDHNLQVSPEDLKKLGSDSGEVFIFQRDTSGKLFYWDTPRKSWVESTQSILQPSYSGKLQTIEFKELFNKDSVKKYNGSRIFAG
jgi:hypothetical protein